MMWEKAFALLSHFRGAHKSHFGICTVMLKKHRGQPIICQDATVINQGEWVGELHLDNGSILKLIQSEGSDRAALQTARMLRKSMQQINEAFESQSEFRQVKALLGITLLHRGLTHGLGFEQQNIKSGFFERITTIYLRLLLSAMHPEGRQRISRRTEQLVPMLLIHSRASLKNRFSPGQNYSG
ncbi:polysaccharide deacetylase [Paenibacillus sp. VTT E-133280]|uniref:YkoP family protein n=2 Tax=Paenibacillus TaxID=44249 RepID=UPI000BC5D143|nr:MULTISPECIES: polysaccharide deacetylase [unclassified Paenibacillus]OZQ68665.1 polysaccharide deacetylase [Paenibacillus sp. VTT E-133280]